MSSRRRTDGDETWNRLREWTKGQKAAERLAGHILSSEGYKSIDPSHPLGGRDGVRDIVCIKDNVQYIGAAYFPRGQKTFKTIQDKFYVDLKGVAINKANGIAFVTNQEISLAERKKLMSVNLDISIEIFHLERLVNILNNPTNYGVRLEFLDISITSEEQLAYFAERDKDFLELSKKLNRLADDLFYNSEQESFSITEGRNEEEIVQTIDELLEKVWYDRHMNLRYRVDNGKEEVHPEIWEGALKSAERILEKYGEENLGPWSDFEWGMLNGKLSTLRWILGDEWDMLDT